MGAKVFHILTQSHRPIAAVVAGKQSKEGRILGHAGAFAGLGEASADFKAQALADAGVEVVQHPSQFASVMSTLLKNYETTSKRSVGLALIPTSKRLRLTTAEEYYGD